LTKAQRGVAVGAGCAAVISLASLGLAAFYLPGLQPATLEVRLHLLVACILAPALSLLVAIGRLANHRFDSPEDIDGSGLSSGSARAKLLQALLQNTLEQLALAAPVYAACALFGSAALLAALPAAAALFLAGRALFFWGYARGAPGRALGFGLTFYPTVILLICALIAAARHAVS